jgi:hypothetical protein
MNANDIQPWMTLVKDLMTILAILVGAAWALHKFVQRREARAKIQFDLELSVVGRADGKLIVELVAIVENKGLVRHAVSDFIFKLFYLPKGAPIRDGDKRIKYSILFEPVIKNRPWMKDGTVYTFVDPGVVQRYRYVTHIPGDAAFALLYAEFKYPDAASDFHSAQRVFNVAQTSELT